MLPNDVLVSVQNEWNGWHKAFVRLCDLQDVCWFQPTGAPKPLIHGYVLCTSIMEGDIPHDCKRTAAPHRLLVCILRRHSTPLVYAEIVRRVGDQSARALPPVAV